jgi:hypothetical protein
MTSKRHWHPKDTNTWRYWRPKDTDTRKTLTPERHICPKDTDIRKTQIPERNIDPKDTDIRKTKIPRYPKKMTPERHIYPKDTDARKILMPERHWHPKDADTHKILTSERHWPSRNFSFICLWLSSHKVYVTHLEQITQSLPLLFNPFILHDLPCIIWLSVRLLLQLTRSRAKSLYKYHRVFRSTNWAGHLRYIFLPSLGNCVNI